MENLYDIIKENPQLIEERKLSKGDIAAANYLYSMSSLVNSEISVENDGAWIHTNSEYNEVVAKVIETYPEAVNLILGLSKGYGIFIGGTSSQFAYLLVNDYLNHNFNRGNRTHKL